ncbi:MAG: DUF885 family protein [Pirellulaceae bacterium]|nr:DUF885 family protein [Pirellulaceae bacterium]
MYRLLVACFVAGLCLPGAVSSAQDSKPSIRGFIERYSADVQTLGHRFRLPLDTAATERRLAVTSDWLVLLREQKFDRLDRAAKVDYLLLKSELEYQLQKIRRDSERDAQAAKLMPYASTLVAFCKAREDVDTIKPAEVADALDGAAKAVEAEAKAVRPIADTLERDEATRQRLTALRASELIAALRSSLREAHGFYSGYDPQYSWWAKQPMERLLAALEKHRVAIRERVVGVPDADQETIIGLPIGDDGLRLELEHEWIAHEPAELIALADREMKWCDEQMLSASRELGFGDDWRKAMEHVKSKHVEPGAQTEMIRNLAWEAIRFLEANDLVTVPALAAQGWRMTMMSPERQRVNPYFLGGDTIIVSYPTDSMTHEEKLMSMRSNNEHFSRATVHHELIPGHHLQFHMLPRYRPYRKIFDTPFWIEGWALYWEMLLWDLDFARNAEDRVGMLFWRRHRCARIVFSLSYHSGKMSPQECVDYLVERVGHERSAAAAEVRRSIMGGYSPLYQAAYMLGGLQFRDMHRELVQGGKMSNRQFHDAILQEHSIPIELLRAYLTGQELAADAKPSWKFAKIEEE